MSRVRWPGSRALTGRFRAKWGLMEEDVRPEQGPTAPEDAPIEPDDSETPYKIDPALMYLVVAAVTLLGLNTFAVEVRYALVWAALAVVGVISLVVDEIAVEPLNL